VQQRRKKQLAATEASRTIKMRLLCMHSFNIYQDDAVVIVTDQAGVGEAIK